MKWAVDGGPSIFFDAVITIPSTEGAADLSTEPVALDWLRDAFAHLKAIGYAANAATLFEAANVDMKADEGLVALAANAGIKKFITAAKRHRI